MGLSRPPCLVHLGDVVRLRLAVLTLLLFAGCADASRPNIVLVTLDTTRPDRLGAYGYGWETSPNLDVFARDAVRYTRALSTSHWTYPAHASLFTGKLPSGHGARYDPEGSLLLSDRIAAPEALRAHGLSPREVTLAQRLAEAGYATAGVVGGPWLLRSFGLAAGFEHYDDADIVDHAGRRAGEIVSGARTWLESWIAGGDSRPFFLFLNFFDPHFPYDPPSNHAEIFLRPGANPDPNDRMQFSALYDAEIHYMDEQIGILFDFLRERGLYRETLIVVTSDHGELFGENGEWGHGGHLYDALVSIPLLVKPPGRARTDRTRDEPVQIHDVYAWILAAAGIGSEDVPAAAADGPRALIAEGYAIGPTLEGGEWKALWLGPLKYHHHSLGHHRLYDLKRDPREWDNLIEKRPEDAERLRERLARELASLPPPLEGGKPIEVDAQTREALERLGYAR